MRSDLAYYLLTAPDLTVMPQPSCWHKLDSQGARLSLLNTGWSASLSVDLEGQFVWQPNINDLAKDEEPSWARSIDIMLYNSSGQVSFGDAVQVSICHAKNVEISYVLLGSKPVNFVDKTEETAITEPIVIEPDTLFHGSHLAELYFTL